MLNTVRATIINNKLLDAGDVVLIGLSGGADSVALLHILNRLKAELNFSLLAAHFNHMLREGSRQRRAVLHRLVQKLGY